MTLRTFLRLARAPVTAVALLLVSAPHHAVQAQEARAQFQEALQAALDANADHAARLFAQVGQTAATTGEQAIEVAAARGRADVWLVLRGCADSAVRILREANAKAATGDRSAADALVRLLAARGDVAGAQAALVAAYSDVDGVGRTITRESVEYMLGRAATERAEGHESAALSTYNEALTIAMRLHDGDAGDAANVHAMGEVNSENAWVLFDLAQLRLHAKSPSIRSAREAKRIYDQLIPAWSTVDKPAASPFPIIRLGDRLLLQAEACQRNGTACPVPRPKGGC